MKSSKVFNRILIGIGVLIILYTVIVFAYNSLEFVIAPSQMFVVKRDILSDEEVVDALVLREEKVITDKTNRALQKDKFEGEKVSKGIRVFRYYSNKENEKIDKIAQIDKEIEEYLIEQQDNINSPENLVIDSSIESKLLEVNSINQQSKILNFEKNINNEVLQKAKIAGELSREGSKIKKLLDEKKAIEKTLTDQSQIVTSPMAGVISYRVDGFESKFDTKDLNKIDEKFIQGFDIKTGSIIPEANNKSKIVNNFETYLVVTSKSDNAENAEVGDKIKVRIGNEDEAVATIAGINEGNGRNIIILRINTNGITLLQYRKVKVEIIWWEGKGLKVSNKSLIKEGDYFYVIRNKAGFKEKILVKLIKETSDYSLIGNYSTEELKDLKLKISEDRVSINENDEILSNPEKFTE